MAGRQHNKCCSISTYYSGLRRLCVSPAPFCGPRTNTEHMLPDPHNHYLIAFGKRWTRSYSCTMSSLLAELFSLLRFHHHSFIFIFQAMSAIGDGCEAVLIYRLKGTVLKRLIQRNCQMFPITV